MPHFVMACHGVSVDAIIVDEAVKAAVEQR